MDLYSNNLRVADERSSRRKRASGKARTSKGRRSRTIPIHPRLRKILGGLPRKADGRVFRAPRGGALRPNNVLHVSIRDVIEPLKKGFPTPPGEIGFEHGRLRSLRHFFCSRAFLGGASEGEIRKWLGHAESKMVEHYPICQWVLSCSRGANLPQGVTRWARGTPAASKSFPRQGLPDHEPQRATPPRPRGRRYTPPKQWFAHWRPAEQSPRSTARRDAARRPRKVPSWLGKRKFSCHSGL